MACTTASRRCAAGSLFGDDLPGFNFTQRPMPLGELVTQLVQGMEGILGAALYAGAVSVAEHLPDLQGKHTLEHAEVAKLNPGGALYLPSHWVHHDESLDTFGLMMNSGGTSHPGSCCRPTSR